MQKCLYLWFLALSVLSHLNILSFPGILSSGALCLHCLPPWFCAHRYSMQSRAQASSHPLQLSSGQQAALPTKEKGKLHESKRWFSPRARPGSSILQHPSQGRICSQALSPAGDGHRGRAGEKRRGEFLSNPSLSLSDLKFTCNIFLDSSC